MFQCNIWNAIDIRKYMMPAFPNVLDCLNHDHPPSDCTWCMHGKSRRKQSSFSFLRTPATNSRSDKSRVFVYSLWCMRWCSWLCVCTCTWPRLRSFTCTTVVLGIFGTSGTLPTVSRLEGRQVAAVRSCLFQGNEGDAFPFHFCSTNIGDELLAVAFTRHHRH